jgi:hypothetical protein
MKKYSGNPVNENENLVYYIIGLFIWGFFSVVL